MSVSRNEPCSCGSGLKFKRCCGKGSATVASRSLAPSAPTPIEFDRLVALFHAGRFATLEAQASLLLKKFPESGLTWKLLCAALQMQGKEALMALQMAARFLPEDAEAQNNLGQALQDRGQFEAAVAAYRRALGINPDNAEVRNNLGTVLHELGRIDEAVESYRLALNLAPHFIIGYQNLGISLQQLGRQDEAIACYRRALEINPDCAEVHWNMGVALASLGQLDAAVACHRRALEIKPDYYVASRSYLTALLYDPEMSSEARFEKLTRFAERLCPPSLEIGRPFTNQPDAHKQLRIGYVSSDFRYHPVGRNILPLISGHERSKFAVYLYGNVAQPDSVTERFKGAVTAWRSIAGMSDQAAAELIRRDEIDILVLLAGRFDDNRPLIAGYRAASVQVSFHDPITSGLKSMDYLLTDRNLSPRDARELFTERLVHLPTFYLHPPLTNVPEVSELPAREKGYVTFGSFNNLLKVNEQVIALWSRVLHAVPGARLVMKFQNVFGNDRVRQRFMDRFLAHGIEAQRLDLVGAKELGAEHLARYATIDIALDPFPFTGSTTTFEALWMGVPVVTLMGDHMVARWSTAMLKKLGLDELIARDQADYVQRAQALAQNLEHLATLRANLRERVAHSTLCDERRRARQIERAYRWMWVKWCSKQAV